MERRTQRGADTVRSSIFKIDAAIIRLLEKRLAQCDEAAWACDASSCVRLDELSSLVIDENRDKIKRIMEQIDIICREKDPGQQ